MPLFDCKCGACGHIWEEMKSYNTPACCCPECGSADTKTLMPLMKHHNLNTKDPYDYLNGPIPDPKPIKSFANDRREGGKDTT